MTELHYYVTAHKTTNGIDGCVPKAALYSNPDCCPRPPWDDDACALACNFINLLPQGPLWDRAKMESAKKQWNWCEPVDCEDDPSGCASLVRYAVYSAHRLYNLVGDALWQAIRESNPVTAYDTQEEWLERLGWTNCFSAACRNDQIPGLSDLEVLNSCNQIEYCGFGDIDPEYLCALRRAIIIALWRLRLQPRKNLCAINFVIEPLGAELGICPDPHDPNVPLPASTDCSAVNLCLYQVREAFPKCTRLSFPPTQDQIAQINDAIGLGISDGEASAGGCDNVATGPLRLGMLAAECIVRSMVDTSGNVTINSVC